MGGPRCGPKCLRGTAPLICPYCGHNDDKVIDSRASDAGKVIRRRRECLKCEKRYTTYERVEQTSKLMVVKRDGRRVPFSRENVLKGIQAAFGKRKTPEAVKERIADEIEEALHRDHDREVESLAIGHLVLGKLREIDEVAYIRFASEYLQIKNARDLMRELEDLQNRPKDVKEQTRLF
jgi:transcriptional repressor NrdR